MLAILQLLKVTKVYLSQYAGSTIYTISPEEAALLVNTIVELYTQTDTDWTTGEILNLKEFLNGQLANTEQELSEVEDSLRDFQEREQVYEVTGAAQLLLKQLTDIEGKYYTTIAEQNIVREKQRYVAEELTEEEKKLTNRLLNTIDNRLVALRLEIASNEADLVKNSSLYGEQHDAVKSIQAKIDRLKQNLEQQTGQLIAQGVSTADPIRYRQTLMDTVLTLNAASAGYDSHNRITTKPKNVL